MPFNDLAQSSSAKRGFADLFADSKAALDNIQAGLGGMLPSMPGMPVAKFGDLSIGIDMHPTVTPPSPVMPVPHVGKIYDLMADIMAGIAAAIPPATSGIAGVACNVLKGMAPSVKVHNQWIAQAGISILHLPAFVLHPAPLVSGMSESEMWMGSSTVLADGAPCSTLTHPSLSCNLVGIPTIPRKGKPKKVSKALMAPTSMLSTITSVGKPVLVGGPPTIDLFALTMKLGLKGIGKIWKKIGDKFQDFIDNLRKKGKNKLADILQPIKCKTFGEPVDAATGRVYHTNVDFELPGPIPIKWERTYYSDAAVDGPLGYNWHHSYNMGVKQINDKAFVIRHADGRESYLPVLLAGEKWIDRKEQLKWELDSHGYQLTDSRGYQYRFNGLENKFGYRMVSSISTRDGFSVILKYASAGRLVEIISSRGEHIKVDTDDSGRVICVSIKQDNEEVKLVRYCYDEQGNMIETIDALNVSKYFFYKENHLLIRLVNQGGMSFHWEYEGNGENARCIHTWGDGGVMEYYIHYGKGTTRIRNGENAVTEYFYGSDKLIYKIIDANGGITRYRYNASEELEVIVNPEGYTRKTIYNDFGFPIRITDENGEDTWLQYDDNYNLTSLRTPEGRQLTWKYDEQDRLVSRTTMNSQTIRYSYKDGLLHTITDGQGRVYTLLFNSHYELESLVFPNGLSRHWFYDNHGRLIEATDIKGNITRYAYDRADNLIRLEEPDGNVHHFEYDAMGNMIHAKDNIREVKFTYGALGILKSREQERHRITFGYNSELQLRRIGNETGENYFFELDGLGQVITEIGFDGLRREYERDGSGRVTRVNRPGGKWTEYLYDGLDNILKELNTTGHTPKIIKYKGERITIYPLNNQEFLSCFFQDNCYAISYQKNLIEAVIDAYVSKESIRSDSLFSQIFQKKKSENTSRLYARTMPIAEWTQYDFQLQGDVIYLTGTCFQDEGKGNDRFPQISHIQPQLLSADYLPAKTYIFFQLGIKDIHGIVSTLAYNDSVVRKELYKDMPCDGEFYQFLEDYAKNEIDIVEFLGKDTTQSHRVMLIPLRDSLSPTLNAWKNIASRTWKQVWYDGHSYPFYTFPNNRLMKHLVSKRASTVEKLTSVMCKQHLLISDREEDIKAYLNKRSYTDLSHLFWEEKLGDLAPQADFTFFADMESVYRRPDEFRTMLPTFFFKHLDFFRQFTITIQFIESGERLSTNITLNYKVKA